MKYVSILVLTIFLFSCGMDEKLQTQQAPGGSPARTAQVEKTPIAMEVAGTIRAVNVAELATRAAGTVLQVPVTAGSKVRKGDLLLLVDDRTLLAQEKKVLATQQEVEQAAKEARHHLEAAEAQKELASNTFERIRALYEKNAAGKQEYEEAVSRKNVAEASWKAATERVAQVESKISQVSSDMEELKANLDYLRILAPFDGVVTSVPVDEGTFANPGQKLVSMEDPDSYQILFSVEQELLPAVTKNKTVSVKIPALSADMYSARISEVSPSLDSDTRTIRIKANLPRIAQIRSGLSGVVLLQMESRSGIWIPQEFLKRVNDIETVMVRQEESWTRILVKSGKEQGGKVEILSGLNEGDEIGIFEVRQ